MIRPEPLLAFNLTVAETETYFVAGALDADAVWVHNCPVGYEVPGERTKSGKPYVGQTSKNSAEERPGNGRDGRTRRPEDNVEDLTGTTAREREVWEQKTINAGGGLQNYDNKINPVSRKKWQQNGIDPPEKPKKSDDDEL